MLAKAKGDTLFKNNFHRKLEPLPQTFRAISRATAKKMIFAKISTVNWDHVEQVLMTLYK